MAFMCNGSEPKIITFNGNAVKTVVFNGVAIWPSAKEITLTTAYTSSNLVLRTAANATTTSGTLTASSRFILVSSTAVNGRVPVMCNGNNGYGIYWVTSGYPKTYTSATFRTNDMIVFCNSSNNTAKVIYAERSTSSAELGEVMNWPLFVSCETEAVDGFYHVRHGEIDGYITTNAMSEVIDLSVFDFSAWAV